MVSTDFIQPNAIAPLLKGNSRDEVLRELSELLVNN